MKLTKLTKVAMFALAAISVTTIAQQAKMSQKNNPMVGGMEMMASKNIVQNALNSQDHTTLVAAVKAAGLVETLSGPGPFTVFAPTNNAFEDLPAGTVDSLLMPENMKMLQGVLTYHVASGAWTSDKIRKAIKSGNGTATIKTVNGGKLWAMMNGPTNTVIKDEQGGIASISTYDVMQSNGVIHVIDRVLMPK